MEPEITQCCKELREEVKDIESRARCLMKHSVFQSDGMFVGQHGEMKGQIMLAVRHLEDARMRLGKVCQYADDGVSIFDKM